MKKTTWEELEVSGSRTVFLLWPISCELAEIPVSWSGFAERFNVRREKIERLTNIFPNASVPFRIAYRREVKSPGLFRLDLFFFSRLNMILSGLLLYFLGRVGVMRAIISRPRA